MRWNEFLDTSNRLVAAATEGDWRSAISRAYYAVYHYFREWLLAKGVDIGNGPQAHHNLYAGLLNCGVTTAMPVARQIDDLRSARNLADYDIGKPVTQATATAFVRQADAVIYAFQSMLTGGMDSTIAQGVKQYLISVGRIRNVP